jgi:hypothetical protein
MYSRKVFCCWAFLLFLVIGCGGNDSSGPSNQIPDVTGSYNGTTTVTFPAIPRTVACTSSTSVTQSGSSVSIAPLQLSGAECPTLSISVGSATIDATGAIGSASGTVSQSCGTYSYTRSGGFVGRNLRMSFVYTSSTCVNMNISIDLSKA